MKNLNMREAYEAWITASTKVGPGSSTSVIRLIPSSKIKAQIVNFGKILHIAWKSDVSLPCFSVGELPLKIEWAIAEEKHKTNNYEIDDDKTVTIRNIQRYQANNYSCLAKNSYGTDKITYLVHVLTPPKPPQLNGSSNSFNSGNIFDNFLLKFKNSKQHEETKFA